MQLKGEPRDPVARDEGRVRPSRVPPHGGRLRRIQDHRQGKNVIELVIVIDVPWPVL